MEQGRDGSIGAMRYVTKHTTREGLVISVLVNVQFSRYVLSEHPTVEENVRLAEDTDAQYGSREAWLANSDLQPSDALSRHG